VTSVDNETANLRFAGQVMKALDNFGVGHPGAKREKQQDKTEGVKASNQVKSNRESSRIAFPLFSESRLMIHSRVSCVDATPSHSNSLLPTSEK
jgi:hypothetical protein